MVYIRSQAQQVALDSPGRMSTICYTERRMVIRAVDPRTRVCPIGAFGLREVVTVKIIKKLPQSWPTSAEHSA